MKARKEPKRPNPLQRKEPKRPNPLQRNPLQRKSPICPGNVNEFDRERKTRNFEQRRRRQQRMQKPQ